MRVGVDAPEVEVEMLRFEGPLGDASRSEAKDERDEEEKSEAGVPHANSGGLDGPPLGLAIYG